MCYINVHQFCNLYTTVFINISLHERMVYDLLHLIMQAYLYYIRYIIIMRTPFSLGPYLTVKLTAEATFHLKVVQLIKFHLFSAN